MQVLGKITIISVSPFQNSILNQMVLYCHLFYIYICHHLEVAYLLIEFSVLDKMLMYSLIVKPLSQIRLTWFSEKVWFHFKLMQ